MRLPKSEHTSKPWRIHELTTDFRLEDVWALPTPGGADEFARLVRAVTSIDPTQRSSRAVRMLFAIRQKLGELLGWDGPDAGIGSRVPTLAGRLPADLREVPSGPGFDAAPFSSLYQLEDEWAAETANRTVHGVMHLGWVPDERGGYRGQLAVLVKPNGLLGSAYLAAIRAFRHLLVYPAVLREIERNWRASSPGQPAPWRCQMKSQRARVSAPRVSSVVGMPSCPEAVRSLTTFASPDYVDVFTVTTSAVPDRSPEEWARTVLENTRIGRAAPKLWRSIGLRLGPRPSPDHVQGWRIGDRGVNWIRLEAASWHATAHAVVRIDDGELSVALFIRYQRSIAALIWPPVSVLHRRGMPHLLRQAVSVQ